MFEPELFRKQIHCIEETTCNISGTFRRPILTRRPGNCAPLSPPRYAPDRMSPSDAVDLGRPCNNLFEIQVVHRYVFIVV